MSFELDINEFKNNLKTLTPDAPKSFAPKEYKEPKSKITFTPEALKRVVPQTITEFRADEENIKNFETVIGYINDNPSIAGVLDFATKGDTDPVEFLRDEEVRIGSMFNRAMVMSDAPEEVKSAYRKLRANFADAKVDGMAEYFGAFKDYGTDVVLNPETLATVAASIFSGGAAAKAGVGANLAARQALKKAIGKAGAVLTSSKPATVAAYGGAFGGVSDLAYQGLEVSLDEKQDISLGQTAATTALGAAAGYGLAKGINKLSRRRVEESLASPTISSVPDSVEQELGDEILQTFESRQVRRAAERAEKKAKESAQKSVRTVVPEPIVETGDLEYIGNLTSSANNRLTTKQYDNLLQELDALKASQPTVIKQKGQRARAAKKEAQLERQQKIEALETKIKAHEVSVEAEAELSRIEQGKLKLKRNEEPSESELLALEKASIVSPFRKEEKVFNKEVIKSFAPEAPETFVEAKPVQEAVQVMGGGQNTIEELEHVAAIAANSSKPQSTLAFKLNKVYSELTAKTIGKASGTFTPYVDKSPTAKKLQSYFAHEFGKTWKQRTKDMGVVEKDFFQMQQEIQGKYFEKFKVSVEAIAKNRINGVLDDEVNSSLNAALRGIKSKNVAINTAALRIKSLYSEMGDALKEAGIIKHKLENYVPRMWRRDAIQNNQEEFAKLLMKHGEAEDLTEAENIIESMLNKKNQIDSGTNGHFFSSTRTFENIKNDADFVDFINDDVVLGMQQYVVQASRSLAKKKRFGVTTAEQFQKKWITAIDEEMFKATGNRLNKREKQRMMDVYRTQTSEGLEGYSGSLGVAVDTYGLANRLAYLPLATLSSLTEVMLNFTKGGVVRSMKGFKQASELGFNTLFKDNHQKLISDLGLTPEEAWREMNRFGVAVEQGLAQMDSRLSGEELATESLQKVSNTFFKVNFLQQWTEFAQATAFYTGKSLVSDNIEDLARLGGKASTRKAKRQVDELLELGVDVDKAVEWFNAGANTKDSFYQETILGAAARYTNEVILQPTSASGLKSKWMSNPKSAPLFQLMSYPTAFTNTVLKGMAKQVTKDKTMALPLIVNALLITEVARGINYIRTKGESENRVDPSEARLEALKRWGGNGIFFDTLQRSKDAAMYSQNPIAAPLSFLGVVGSDATRLMDFKPVETLGTKVPGYSAGKMFLGDENMREYRKFLKRQDKKLKKKLTPKYPFDPVRANFFEGGEVSLPVPQAPLDPSTRIDKMTGLPYNVQAERKQFAVGGAVGKGLRGLAKVIDDATGNVFKEDEINKTVNRIKGYDDDAFEDAAEAQFAAQSDDYDDYMDFDNDVPMDIAPDEYIEAFVISDFAEVQHRKSLQELAEYDDYTDGLRAKGFSEEQIEASELFTELQSEVDVDGGVMYDLYEAVSDLKDAYSRLGGHENKDYAPKNIDSPVFSFIKNELSKKPEGKLLTEEGIERYAQRYLQELEEDERLQGSLERILSSFPKQVSTTKIAKEVDSVLRQQSQEEFIKDSMVKAPVYRAVSEYQDLEYDIAFAVPREIGVHVGTEGQASQIALLSAGVEPEDFAKISNKSTVDRAEYNELFANILKPDAAVTVNKGFINIKKPLVLEDPETIRAFNTFEADLIVFRPDDDTPELIDYIEDEIAEQAGKSTTEIRAGLNKLNKLERILAELKSEVADDNYQQRILNFKQDVIKAEINTEFREWLKSLGFDSIKYKNIKERSLPTEDDYSYILFEPEQFKSFAASEFNPDDKRASFAEGGIAKLLGLNEEDIEWAKGLSKKFAENEELDGRGDAARHLALGWLASKTESPNLTHFAINARETFDVQGREMDRHNNDLGFTLSSKDKKEAEKEILKLIKDKKAMYFSPEESVMRRGYEEGGYVVKEGDTLSEIASMFGTTTENLAELNGIDNADQIRAGDNILLG